MKNFSTSRRKGFVLIEALVALLIIAFGVVAITQLQVLSLFGSSEAKARSEAMALSQVKLESLRNLVEKSKFTGNPMPIDEESPLNFSEVGEYATYSMEVKVDVPSSLEQRVLTLTTSWTDSKGGPQSVVLNSVIAWDDPSLQASASSGLGGTLISPTGSAKRMVKKIPGQKGVYTDSDKKTYLLDNDGNVLIYLDPVDGEAQGFATITGKIFFDQNAGNNAIPSSTNVRVRLSSEGECIYNNAVLSALADGSNSFKYFSYTCYVGPGWYGNVGVLVDDDVGGNVKPAICIGDPGFNAGKPDGTLISAHPVESATRSYRGFKGTVGNYLSTGMQGESVYGLTTTGTTRTGLFDGRPRPSEYPSHYSGITAGSTNDYFEQNYLITSISGKNKESCASKMSGGLFTRNAGKYVCINPDNDSAADVCPPIWPGFESQVGSGGGSIEYSVTVTTSGSGIVRSDLGGINCGASCSANYASGTIVTLTAEPAGGASFTGWTGCGTNPSELTCTVTEYAVVTASFSGGTTPHILTVAKTGSGTVTSDLGGIDCGLVCSTTFTNETSVTLTAVESSGSIFTGWSGACTGTGGCTVLVNGTTSVTANFAVNATPCDSPITGTAFYTGHSGRVIASQGGNCTVQGNSTNFSCSLNLPPGTVVTLTNVPNDPTLATRSTTATTICGTKVNVKFTN